MKFGKKIAQERAKNPSLYYINYKVLKQLIGNIVSKVENGLLAEAYYLHNNFYEKLYYEMSKVADIFDNELKEVHTLSEIVKVLFPLVMNQSDPIIFKNSSFDQLLDSLRLNYSTESIYEMCVNLANLSNQCRYLRQLVIFNGIAVVKILKKKKKMLSIPFIEDPPVFTVLSQQSWYCSSSLHHLISSVDTMMEEVFCKITHNTLSKDQWECPICLDVIVDPVTLKGCFHRFCWNCLAKASIFLSHSEEQERCPICRTRCSLNPEEFVTDGILSLFLRRHFPEETHDKKKNEVLHQDNPLLALNDNNKFPHKNFSFSDDSNKSNTNSYCSDRDSDNELLDEAAIFHMATPTKKSHFVNRIHSENEDKFDMENVNNDLDVVIEGSVCETMSIDTDFSRNSATLTESTQVTSTHTSTEYTPKYINDYEILPQSQLKGILPTPNTPPSRFEAYLSIAATRSSCNRKRLNKK